MAAADGGGGVGPRGGALDQQLARLPAALQGLQDRAVAEAVEQARGLLGEHLGDRHRRQALAVVLDGGGVVVPTGTKCDLAIPWPFVIESWVLYADVSGSLTLDLQTAASYAAFPAGASICASAKPLLAGAQKATDSALTGWTTTLPGGGVLRVVVESASAVQVATLTLFLRAV